MANEQKHSVAISFEGGSLTIRRSGYMNNGSGYFAWKDSELEWDEEDYRSVEVPMSELIFLRDKLIEEFPLASSPVAEPVEEGIAHWLQVAIEEFEAEHGRPTSPTHWINVARAALSKSPPPKEKIVAHVRAYDTPNNDDPRRRYTEAQLDLAIRLAREAQ